MPVAWMAGGAEGAYLGLSAQTASLSRHLETMAVGARTPFLPAGLPV